MKFLASFAILILMSSQITFAEEFAVPELPQVSYDEIENELVENEDKERSPSNSDEESVYQPAADKVQIWDYQKIIDRHDKH